MCGLFGFVHYGKTSFKNLSVLTNSLAEYSAVRGTDATGIAFVQNSNIQIYKEARSAYAMDFKHPDTIKALIGHTRHATHGSAKKNQNNHPFFGKAGTTRFAFAHNGVLCTSMMHYNLPKTKIETDSYIAVQLIEQQKKLTFDSLRTMAETVSGSFSFSLLDDKNNLWLVKGDSPISLLHFPEKQIYVYASTDEILYKALVDSPLFTAMKKQHYEVVPIEEGTILKITNTGELYSEPFRFMEYSRPGWWEYGYFVDPMEPVTVDQEYLEALRIAATYRGIETEQIDYLLECGYTLEEIEDAIYEV